MSSSGRDPSKPSLRHLRQLWLQKAMDESDEDTPKEGGVEGGGSNDTASGNANKKGQSPGISGGTAVYDMDDNADANNGESVSSIASTTYAREDSIRSGKSVTISFSDSVGDKEDIETRSISESTVIGWRPQVAYRGASSAGRPLGSILENVRDQGQSSVSADSGMRRGTIFSRDFYNKPAPSNPNTKLLAVSYPVATAEERKNKNIKVSSMQYAFIIWNFPKGYLSH